MKRQIYWQVAVAAMMALMIGGCDTLDELGAPSPDAGVDGAEDGGKDMSGDGEGDAEDELDDPLEVDPPASESESPTENQPEEPIDSEEESPVEPEGPSETAVELSITQWNFLGVVVTNRETKQFSLTNVGDVDVQVDSVDLLQDEELGAFLIVLDTCGGNTLASGERCVVHVRFAPEKPVRHEAQLLFNDSSGGLLGQVDLRGTGRLGAPAFLDAPETQVDFGDRSIFQPPTTMNRIVRNTGDMTSGTPTVTLHGPNAREFEVSGCATPIPGGGGTCRLIITYWPNSSGLHRAFVSVGANPGGGVVFDLSGFGRGQSQLVISPAAEDFPDTALGTASVPVTFEVMNVGHWTSQPIGVYLRTAGFLLTGGTTCRGRLLSPSETCLVEAIFTPTRIGLHSGTVVVDDGDSNAVASLTGLGIE